MKANYRVKILWAAIICALLLGVAYWHSQNMDIPDFLSYWAAGRLVGQGQDPYDETVWRELVYQIQWNFEYPLITAIFFVPWGFLPYRFAFMLWMFFSAVCMTATGLVLLGLRRVPGINKYLLPIFAGLVIFRPAIVQIRNGQISGVITFIFVMGIYLAEKGKDFSAGILSTFVLLKHNLGLPLLGLWGLWILCNRRKKALLGMAIGTAVLLGGGFLVDPHWVTGLLKNNSQRLSDVFGYNPSLWGLANSLCNYERSCQIGLGAGAVIAVVVGLLVLFLIRKVPPFEAGALCVSSAILISPYGWGYDHIYLVIPILYIIIGMIKRGLPFLAIGLTVPLFSILGYVLLGVAMRVGNDTWGCIPAVLCLAGCGYLVWSDKRISTE